MNQGMDYAYLAECRRREEGRPAIERARNAANESVHHCNNDVIRGKAQALTALATAEALTRIADSLERIPKEMDVEAEEIREARGILTNT